MLTLRQAQMDAFERADSPLFEARALAHLEAAFPRHWRFLDDDARHALVRDGIARAAAYGLDRQSVAELFIDLTLLLGHGFDTDPQLPWAGEILAAGGKGDALATGRRLHAMASAYLDAVSGPDNAFIDAAQRRLADASLTITPDSPAYEAEAAARLRAIWPEKHTYLGDAGLHALIVAAGAASHRRGLDSGRARLLFAGVMFMMGSGFEQDPMCAWARTALDPATLPDPDARTERLRQAALDYLGHWCA